MKLINWLIILTISLNLLILIGAGEGITIFGLFEVIAPNEFIHGHESFTLRGDDKLFTSALIALIGHIILIFSCLIEKHPLKIRIIYFGLLITFLSFIILITDFISDFSSSTFWSTIPFLITAVILLISTFKQQRKLKETADKF